MPRSYDPAYIPKHAAAEAGEFTIELRYKGTLVLAAPLRIAPQPGDTVSMQIMRDWPGVQ